MENEYTGYSGDQRRFQKSEPKPSVATPDISQGRIKKRQYLDSAYDIPSMPYESWKLKRSDLRRELKAKMPNITPDELEYIYEQYNLGQNTNPGDFSRAKDFGGTVSRAGSLIANQAGAFVELGEFLFDRATGDEEGMVQNQEDLEEIGYENSLIHQYQSKDMNPVTQFLFDLAVSVPTMAFVMAGGALAGLGTAKVAAVAGVGAVGTWIAGTLGFNAVEALVESGFNYIDIISDPMVVKKIEDTLGREMTDEDKENIRVHALEVLSDRADDSAKKVALGNFFNPLNFGHTFGAGRLAKLIKVASGKWGTARRLGTRVAGREALEEALQSAGSQYTASEAKMLALQDVGAEMPFPLREGTIYGIDPQQVGYEALMGGVVGKVLGFGQGYLGHGKWEKGVYNLDKYGNPVRRGDPQKLDEEGEVILQPGDEGFVGKGRILHEVRKLIDIPSSEAALLRLDDFRQKEGRKAGGGRVVRIIDEEIGYMKQGADLMGEKTDPKKTTERRDRATAFEPNTHNIVEEEVVEDPKAVELERIRQEIVDGAGEPVAEATRVQPLDLNEDPVLKANVNRIVKTPEDQRVPRDKAYLDLAKSNKELDNRQVNDVIKNMEKGGTLPKVTPATVADPLVAPAEAETQAQPAAAVTPADLQTTATDTEQVSTVTGDSVAAEVITPPEVKVETAEAPVVLNQSGSSKEITQILKQWAGKDELIYSDKEQHGKNSSALKKYGEKNELPFDKKNRYSFTPEQRVEVAASIAAGQGITPSETVILPTPVPKKATDKQTTAQKATAKADAEAKVEAEAMSERASQGAKEDAAEAVPFAPELKYKIKLLDRDGKPIGRPILDFKTKESKDLVQSLVGKIVLHYKQASGFRNEDPSSFPKKVVKWRFDGIDYDGNIIFTKANKGAWKAGETFKGAKTIRDHAVNKTGKHSWDAEQMFLHLLSNAGETYSGKTKGKDVKFINGFLTEGVESDTPQRVAEGEERVEKKVTLLDQLLKKYRGREEQVATDTILEGVESRQKSADLKTPEQVFAETEGNIDAREEKKETIAAANKKKRVLSSDDLKEYTGQGTHTLKDGRIYVGGFKDGEFHGQGTLTSPDGTEYLGKWTVGKRNGKGTNSWPSGQRYEGGWKDDKKWNGTQYNKDGRIEKLYAKGKERIAKSATVTKEAEAPVTPPVVEEVVVEPVEEVVVEPEVVAEPEVVVEPTDVGTPTLTRTEVEGTIPETITDDVKEVWVDELMKKPRIKNLTLWDATDWKETNNHIGKELREDMATTGGTQDIVAVSKAPPELRKLIQRKLTAWLVGTADPDTFDSVRVRYFPMLLDKQKSEVASAVGRKTGVAPAKTETTTPPKEKYTPQEEQLKTGKKMPEVRINSRGLGGVELLFKKPISITSGSEQYSSEGVLWMGDAMNVGVTNNNNEEIGFKVTTDRNKGTLGIDIVKIDSPKEPKAPLPHMNEASIDAQWKKVFGAEKVATIKNISFTVPKSNVFKTHPNISEALDKALDILLPGTRGYVNVSYVMQTDTGITLGAGKPIIQQLPIVQGKPWSKEVIKDAQARVNEALKKKSLVSDDVAPEAVVTTEPTLTKDAVKATKKVPFKKASTPEVWQILTSEVQQIFDLAGTSISDSEQNKIDTFIESLGSDDAFIVSGGLSKGAEWKIYRLNTDIDINAEDSLAAYESGSVILTSLDPKGNPVPPFIKNVLQKHGRVLSTDRKTNNLLSRKLDRTDLIEPPEGSPAPPSDILARVDRDVDVNLTELETTVNEMPIVWAFKTKSGKLVELQYMEAAGKGATPESVNVEFKDEATALRYVEAIRSKAPKNKELLQMDEELIEQFTNDNKKLSMHGEAQIETMTAIVQRNASDYAELFGDEFQGSAEDYYKSSELDSEVKIYTKEEIEAYEATLKDPNTHYSLKEDTVTISPEAKKPTVDDINGVIETFKEQFPGIISKIELITEPSNPFYMDKRGVKGAYSPSEDTIYLVAGNLASKEDAAMTLLHEGVGHRSYKNPDTNILNDEKRSELEELVKTSFPEDYATEYEKQLGDIQGGKKDAIEGMTDAETAHTLAAQEVLAHKVERMTKEDFDPTIEEQFSAWMRGLLRDFFKKMGLGEVKLTDNEVKILFNRLALDLSLKNRAGISPYVGEATELPSDAMFSEVPAHERFKNMGDIGIAQLEAMNRLFPDRNSRTDNTKSGWWGRFWARAQWDVLDPHAVVKNKVGEVPYMKQRLANREDGVMATLLNHSLVKVKEVLIDGIKVKETHLDETGKPLWGILRVFGNEDEVDSFIAWYGMHRADRLEKEIGEETLGILRKDIDAILDPVTGNIAGTMKDATTGVIVPKKLIYEQAAKEMGLWNKSVANIGIDLGLFNNEVASNWVTEWYLPLFRYFEEDIGKDVPRGTRNYKSLTGQTGIKKLKGSKRPLDNMLNNLVRNALHIVSASLKNDAATLTLSEAEKIKDPITGEFLAQRTKHPGPDSLRIIKDGKDVHYNISNELLYKSLGQLNVTNDFAGLGLAIGAKNLFTVITTANPLFKKRNLLKDTMNAAAQTEAGFNVFKNATGGWKEIGDNKAELLVSGAYMQFGYLRSDDPNYSQKLLTKEMRAGFIGMNPRLHEGYMNALKKYGALARGVWDRYQNWGDKAENANRAWVYKTHLDKGDSQTKAAFEAKDVHDFTLHGGARWVNLITSVTPFANAMLQGKYKMGRSLIKNPKPVVIVSTAITIASLAEYFMYEDNEEWQRRQDWDKDGFWWIKIPGTDMNYRMPKPHELSIVANLTWRGVEMARKKDPINGELFASALKSVLVREFNMSLIPQVARPFVEVGFNENFFFDRPIEPYRFKNMTPKEKRDLYTSETMIRMSQAFDWGGVDVSPMQLSHIVNGYFGWVGEMAVFHADMLVSKDNDFPVRPASKIMDHPILRRTFQTSPIRNTRSGTRFYERVQDIEQAYNDLQLSKKLGDWDRYKEIYEEKKDLLKWRDFIKKKQRIFNELNKRIRVIRFDRTMSPENKRSRMDQLYALRNQIMDKIADSPALR